ncbi:MAG: peroxidase [Micromonosporaceae bacterium]|nr:peroxidase [Micromonosporaceae bacterium]
MGFAVALVAAGTGVTSSANAQPTPASLPFEVQSLDGSGNNQTNPTWGQVGNDYSRVGPATYADGLSEPVAGPDPRSVSNRIVNDIHQNLFSERNVTQWGFAWGQFLDHSFGLRLGAESIDPPGEDAPLPFDPDDPLEEFENDLGVIGFSRSTASPGTGVTTPREQVNVVSSYVDGWAVYGGTDERLEWLREGPVDGDLSNNGARLLLPDEFLPRQDVRGAPGDAPFAEIGGRLLGQPGRAAVAGDVRANENQALTAVHTLFAREHNRIADSLPDSLTEQEKFEIARRVVIAEQQHITYNEFLPALGVTLPAYTGYDPTVNTDLSNEFAATGYRGHSFIHGEIEVATELSRYTPEDLAALEELGVELIIEGDEIEIVIPLNLAFFNPDLVELVGLGPLAQGLGLEPQYKNDEQIDNQLRSVLFQIPVPGNEGCLDGPDLPQCFDGVVDLGAIDIARGRDHGVPLHNDLREAYGLPRLSSFTELTGEDTEEFPPGLGIDDPASLEFVELRDIDGNVIDPADEEAVEGEARFATRATTLAARLKAVYGSVDNLDGFIGMLAEPHLPGSEFSELQLAIWTREFTNLRDGDRFFYGNDPGLTELGWFFGLDFRRTLADVIADNTDIPAADLNDNVFLAAEVAGEATCHIEYDVASQWTGAFHTNLRITNTSDQPLDGWELAWQFRTGQQVNNGWNGVFEQDGPEVTVTNASWNARIEPGAALDGVGFIGGWDNATNAQATHFTVNGARCTRG